MPLLLSCFMTALFVDVVAPFNFQSGPSCTAHCHAAIQHGITFVADCRISEVDVNVAVVTNILKDKVDEFGGIEAYLQAQGVLLSKLQDEHTQRLVVNIDGALPARVCKPALRLCHQTPPSISSLFILQQVILVSVTCNNT